MRLLFTTLLFVGVLICGLAGCFPPEEYDPVRNAPDSVRERLGYKVPPRDTHLYVYAEYSIESTVLPAEEDTP